MANLANAETWPGIGPPEGASIATPLDETGKIMRETLDLFFGRKSAKILVPNFEFSGRGGIFG